MADDVSDRAVTPASGQSFGRRLREQRERSGVTLNAIAASTKIKSSLLAGLERGDISDWPAGIFGRSFVREYARAIGLPPEPVVAEFVRIFVGEATPGDPAAASPTPLRLTLAFEPPPLVPVTSQTLVIVAEATALVTVAALVAWLTPAGFAAVCGGLAFLYYGIATAWLGCSPAAWYLKRELVKTVPVSADRAAFERRDRLYLVKPAADGDRAVASDDTDSTEADSALRRSAMR